MAMQVRIGGQGELFVGEDKVLRFNIVDADGNAVDISGWTMRFVVRATANAAVALIDKPATVSGTFGSDFDPQRATVVLTDTDMSIAKGKHQYSLKRTDDGSETILAYGDFVVEQATQV